MKDVVPRPLQGALEVVTVRVHGAGIVLIDLRVGTFGAVGERVMSGQFTTREIAIAIWVAVFLGWALAQPAIRASFISILRTATHWKLIAIYLVPGVYIAGVVGVLYAVGWWNINLLKDTVVWFLFSGIALAASGLRLGTSTGEWRAVLRDQVKALILVEYVVNTYTFSLWIELLLVPLLVFIALLDVVAQMDPKTAAVAKLTTALQAILGLIVIASAIHHAVATRDTFSSADALRSLALAPLLSLSLLPVVFFFSLIAAYEELFVRLDIGLRKDSRVVRCAKRVLFRHLELRPSRVRAFTRDKEVHLLRVETEADVDALVLAEDDREHEHEDGKFTSIP
jgi:hypothetical protein